MTAMARGSLRAAGRLLVAAGAVVWLGGQGKPSGAVHHVAMKAVDFEPKRVVARVGDTIEWANDDVVAHTATAKGSFDVNVLPRGRGRASTTTPGTFAYICRYHPNMRAEILVEP